MTTSPGFAPWTTLRKYPDAGQRLELETFIEGIGPSEAFRALLCLDSAARERVLTALWPTEAAEFNFRLDELDNLFECHQLTGAALAGNTRVAVSLGGTVPLLLKRLEVDPAVASSAGSRDSRLVLCPIPTKYRFDSADRICWTPEVLDMRRILSVL